MGGELFAWGVAGLLGLWGVTGRWSAARDRRRCVRRLVSLQSEAAALEGEVADLHAALQAGGLATLEEVGPRAMAVYRLRMGIDRAIQEHGA